jgi:hypothetical protein
MQNNSSNSVDFHTCMVLEIGGEGVNRRETRCMDGGRTETRVARHGRRPEAGGVGSSVVGYSSEGGREGGAGWSEGGRTGEDHNFGSGFLVQSRDALSYPLFYLDGSKNGRNANGRNDVSASLTIRTYLFQDTERHGLCHLFAIEQLKLTI